MGTSGVFDSVQVSLGRKEQACPLLSPPVFLPCFPAHSTSISYDAAVGASLLLIFELRSKDVKLLVREVQWERCFAQPERKGNDLSWSPFCCELSPHCFLINSFLLLIARPCLVRWGVPNHFSARWDGILPPHSPPSWDLQWFGCPTSFPFRLHLVLALVLLCHYSDQCFRWPSTYLQEH